MYALLLLKTDEVVLKADEQTTPVVICDRFMFFYILRIYGIENRALKQAVRRNLSKFPEDFMFRLSDFEANELISSGVSRFVIPVGGGHNTGGSNIFALWLIMMSIIWAHQSRILLRSGLLLP